MEQEQELIIIPRLGPGVLIHVSAEGDVSLPRAKSTDAADVYQATGLVCAATNFSRAGADISSLNTLRQQAGYLTVIDGHFPMWADPTAVLEPEVSQAIFGDLPQVDRQAWRQAIRTRRGLRWKRSLVVRPEAILPGDGVQGFVAQATRLVRTRHGLERVEIGVMVEDRLVWKISQPADAGIVIDRATGFLA